MLVDTPRLELRLDTPKITLVVGEKTEQKITLLNQTPLPDLFTFVVEGIPGSWCSFSKFELNMLPNWVEQVTLTIEVPRTAKANRYVGQVVVAARSQLTVRAKTNLELEVLAPLELNAYLRPHRARGFRANYTLILRNPTPINSLVSLRLNSNNPNCVAHFPANQVNLLAGQARQVKLKLQLQPKAPPDQAAQRQEFAIGIQPQWQLGEAGHFTPGTEQLLSGQYIPQSRWYWVQNHRRLLIAGTILLLLVLLWSIALVPLIRLILLEAASQKINPQGPASQMLRIEQNSFNYYINSNINPVEAIAKAEIHFDEPGQKTAIHLKILFYSADIVGRLEVSPTTSDLSFKADQPDQLKSFPWFFLPPDEVVQRLNAKLKDWLTKQGQRLTASQIEGNTLYLRLKNGSVNATP